MIYSFWIFDRHCNCIYNRDFAQHKPASKDTVNRNNDKDEAKLLFGAIFSMSRLSSKLSDGNVLQSFRTGKYKAHLKETATGLRFILISDSNVGDLSGLLNQLYSDLYLNTIVKNGLSPVDFKEGMVIKNMSFINGADELITQNGDFI
ncbi:Trafficking protein particle complex (TRAPP) subunit [Komagataella phaffii CBS 7435]|uniref:Trafficking protein particle complex subunit n=2 Tax=Komagataella phaffii TaxID=460519 RepID=C4R2G8_KOMPG|nr:Component of the TRAPP (transport protein particle) complex [Komagataella phaffii GS115]CAH2447754.1 Trafficking protein particle complex (TRAPP) subunit [Komagataella phaffii CBS 7435]CAY69692.1 Component of the TRAPP (transport protein particle) complex [Komagataella phaffii GS115]CCA37932.1 Trafficking protein particle complex (TRAPP) subunit [Komagataella phaffii CBS 7435]